MNAPSRALCAALAFASTAAAQAPPPDTARADSARRLRTVTVTETRAAGATGGASTVVLRADQLRASPAPVLEQALRDAPFVHVRQNSRGEMELSVRGSDSRQAAVIVDGVPMTLGWDHRTDPSLIPVTGSQKVVIVRGLASLLNGPNTLGGSIEISHDDVAMPPGSQVWAGAGVDDNAAMVGTVGAARRIAGIAGGSLVLRGGLAHRQRDGFALPAGTTDTTAEDGLRTNSDLTETDAFATMRWSTRGGRFVGLSASGFNAERGVPPEEHVTTPRLWRYPYSTRAVTALSAGSGSFATPFGFGSVEVGGGYNAGRNKIETYDNRAYTTVTGEELGDERTLTGRARVTHSLPLGATLKAAITMADVRYAETLSPAPAVDYRQTLLSAGGEVEVPAGSRTVLGGGMVFDEATTRESGGRTPAQDVYDNLGWRLGLSHDRGSWQVHASASERSRFPSLRELYSGALDRFRPNPDLKPETLRGYEAGVTVSRPLGAIPDATFQLTAFRHDLRDAVVRITLANPTRFMRINRDRIESTGAEVLVGLVFGTGRERAVTLSGDATIQSIKIFDQTANAQLRHAENNPERRGTVELGVPLPYRIRGIANARYTGTQYCLNADTQSEMALDGQTKTDLAVERTFTVRTRTFNSLRALLSLDNVSNKAVYDQCGLPQPGRTLRVMFSVR